MSEFEHVRVVQKANIYFDGKVSSRTLIFPDGSKKTLGLMLPGEYTFNTGAKELMEIFSGDLEVLLPPHSDWQHISGGQAFEVPENSSFTVRIHATTDYCCSFFSSEAASIAVE
jgi:uncharacterized protein YaiE (UPF0345 family)